MIHKDIFNTFPFLLFQSFKAKLRPIMLKNLPIMLLSIAQKIAHYAQNYAHKIQLCSCSIMLISACHSTSLTHYYTILQ